MDVKNKKEKSPPEVLCCFSKLVITDKCVAYGSSTRKNNSNYYGPFYNLGVAILWILHTFKDKKPEEKRQKLRDLCSNFPLLNNNKTTINCKELELDKFLSSDGIGKARLIEQYCQEYNWFGLTNTTKEAYLTNKSKSISKPVEEPEIHHTYCIPTKPFDESKKLLPAHYHALKETEVPLGKIGKYFVLWIHRGTTYAIHYNKNEGDSGNEVLKLIFPGIDDLYDIKGKVVICGLKPLHRLNEASKAEQRSSDFSMDKAKEIALTDITAKPFDEGGKPQKRTKDKKSAAEEFLRNIVNFNFGGDE